MLNIGSTIKACFPGDIVKSVVVTQVIDAMHVLAKVNDDNSIVELKLVKMPGCHKPFWEFYRNYQEER